MSMISVHQLTPQRRTVAVSGEAGERWLGLARTSGAVQGDVPAYNQYRVVNLIMLRIAVLFCAPRLALHDLLMVPKYRPTQ